MQPQSKSEYELIENTEDLINSKIVKLDLFYFKMQHDNQINRKAYYLLLNCAGVLIYWI